MAEGRSVVTTRGLHNDACAIRPVTVPYRSVVYLQLSCSPAATSRAARSDVLIRCATNHYGMRRRAGRAAGGLRCRRQATASLELPHELALILALRSGTRFARSVSQRSRSTSLWRSLWCGVAATP